jgi:regulation of enolase protein 1 (concanavalin A-like superfamily)
MQPYPVTGPLTIRLTASPVEHAKVVLEYHDGNRWILMREVTGWNFGKNMNINIGVMACSPGNSTFKVEFWDIIAQDYSELEFQKGLEAGTINPNLNPDLMRGS